MSTSERPGLLQLPPAAAHAELQVLGQRSGVAPEDRARLEWRAKLLAWAGNGWHLVEFAVALGAGIAASSVALIGFGLDSLIEVAAAGVVIWLFSGGRGTSHQAERRAQQLIAASYGLLVAYVAVEAVRDLVGAHHPAVSWVGIGLAAFTAPTMPLLARPKRRVGQALNSSATVSEAGQNMIHLASERLPGAGHRLRGRDPRARPPACAAPPGVSAHQVLAYSSAACESNSKPTTASSPTTQASWPGSITYA